MKYLHNKSNAPDTVLEFLLWSIFSNSLEFSRTPMLYTYFYVAVQNYGMVEKSFHPTSRNLPEHTSVIEMKMICFFYMNGENSNWSKGRNLILRKPRNKLILVHSMKPIQNTVFMLNSTTLAMLPSLGIPHRWIRTKRTR